MKKTARIIITLDCNRNCPYCVNKYEHIIKRAKEVNEYDLGDAFSGYDELVITGGEPLLNIGRTEKILKKLCALYDSKIYLYTALYHEGLYRIMNYIDGLTYTVHSMDDWVDYDAFHDMQKTIADYYQDKEFRLTLNPNIKKQLGIYPYLWKVIKSKNFKSKELCAILPHETLFIYKE